MKRAFPALGAALGLAGVSACLMAGPTDYYSGVAWGWLGFGKNSTHDAIAYRRTSPPTQVIWSAAMDLDPQYSGNVLFIHYGSPLATPRNTIIYPVKTGAEDGWRVEARRGATGALVWMMDTDYSLPAHGWTPEVGPAITPGLQVLAPAGGGTLLRRASADAPVAPVTRNAFYGIAAYNLDPGTFNANVRINTPITVGADGAAYFGFVVSGPTPVPLQSGIARVDAAGNGTWVSAAAAAGDPNVQQVVHNCAPAVTADGSSVYIAVRDGDFHGWLLRLDGATLTTTAARRLVDAHFATDAHLLDDGTSSPTIGPDGDVYFGVFENPYGAHGYRGWMNHYSADLSVVKTPGAFGWDNTPSIVPASAVPGYSGGSPYLLFTKYNNYAQGGGDGINKIAVLDPFNSMIEPGSGATVMAEVLTIPSPTPDPNNMGPSSPDARTEWCINSAAIDVGGRCALVGNEDGKLYRWDFTSNTVTQITLTADLAQAYTPTIIGPDGTIYAIHNAHLFAVR